MPEDNQGLGTQPNNPTDAGQPAPQDTPNVQGVDQQAVATDEPVFDVPNVGQVPQSELYNGYLRQQDYTRKTQELSQQREDIQVAQEFLTELERDPQTAIRALGEAWEVDWGTFAQEPAPDTQVNAPGPDNTQLQLPNELRSELDEIRTFVREQREQSVRQEVQNEIESVKQAYGEFPVGDVINFALQRGIPDIEVAYLAWDRNRQFAAERQQEGAQQRDAATIESGTTTASTPSAPDTIAGAFEAALQGKRF